MQKNLAGLLNLRNYILNVSKAKIRLKVTVTLGNFYFNTLTAIHLRWGTRKINDLSNVLFSISFP
jgi:hypothetical protein